uniref:Nucleolar protein 56 n=1 Tax=Parasteatoda tepidariorum TaxID=114398 RepID=A0A2L2YA35_PARTP
MHQLYVLYEDATGYALFRTTEFEEIATFLPQVQDSVIDISKFRSVVFLVAFQKFETWREGLENLKCVSTGSLHKDLQLFLENNVPKSKKSTQRVMLGVQDPALATEIKDTLGLNCSSSGAVTEIIRGIRMHFRKLMKSFHDENTIMKSKLAMGHHFARVKVNLTINKVDNMITHGLNVVDQLKRDVNTLALRVRRLYDCHFPELFKLVPDPQQYIMCVKVIKDRKNMPENIEELLQCVLKDENKVENILKNAQKSMGMEIAVEDMDNIINIVEQILSLMKQQNTQTDYVKSKMHLIAPSLGNLMGEMAGARLINQAGSLTHLSKLPASTVQILGAKKSLFRALKSKEASSKFSSISKSSLIGQDGRITKGRMSRFLANKCSLAARSDCFSVDPSGIHGEQLKIEVENRVKFYVRKNPEKKHKKGRKKSKKVKIPMEIER